MATTSKNRETCFEPLSLSKQNYLDRVNEKLKNIKDEKREIAILKAEYKKRIDMLNERELSINIQRKEYIQERENYILQERLKLKWR